jgi:hypothetical protein
MSYESGWKALNLQDQPCVPRTEYTIQSYHWEALKKITGIDTDLEANRPAATLAFVKKWDYAFMWCTYVSHQFHSRNGGRVTDMGHAVYTDNGSDMRQSQKSPFEDINEIWKLDFHKEYGEFDQQALVKEFEAQYKEQTERWDGCAVTMGGVYITMVSGLLNILGWDSFLMALGEDEKKFAKIMDGYYEWVKQFFEAYAKTNIPVLMCHDDMVWTSGPFARPEWYRKNIFPKLKKLLSLWKEAGKKVMFTSDGNYTEFFDDVVDCGADSLVFEPCNDVALFAKKHGKTHGFVGAADCRVLLDGSKEDIYREVRRCMDIGKKYPGFIMAVGNHIPANTPVGNVLHYNDAYESMKRR